MMVTIILPDDPPEWLDSSKEFRDWYKKTYPKKYEKELYCWGTPKEIARHMVDKIFSGLRQQAGEQG
jgi:hypothetical protein